MFEREFSRCRDLGLIPDYSSDLKVLMKFWFERGREFERRLLLGLPGSKVVRETYEPDLPGTVDVTKAEGKKDAVKKGKVKKGHK